MKLGKEHQRIIDKMRNKSFSIRFYIVGGWLLVMAGYKGLSEKESKNCIKLDLFWKLNPLT